ncbi:cytochrome P450 [Saccharothrix sp. NRRL B-16348]|uniref:cytochrome P450 n=1 Tax=Saccharothrix sp. NRRL B-16348 TaxID=1415542 RepID=UPI0006ADD6E5|nr:cytochrome P450 [Saccharothrix sp. NRRL B-16348]KOX14486.1 cytochrome P450 [Saccharothrix sp. NRRL B-16348]
MTSSPNAGETGITEAPTVPGRLPLLGHTASLLRQRLAFTADLRSHGPVVRVYLGRLPLHFVTTAELAHQVLTGETDKFDKGIFVDKLRRAFGNGLVSTDGDVHRRQRRMIQPAFHRRPLTRYSETMTALAAELANSWRDGQVLELDRVMQDLAITVVGRTLFSADFGPSVSAEIRAHTPTLIRLGVVRALSPAGLEKLPIPANRRFDRAVAHVHRVVDDVVDSARGDRDDLLSALLNARDEGTGAAMDRQQVRDEVVTLLTAGTETTGIALSWLFHELARDPEVERRVHAEVDDVLAGRAATVDDLRRLPYLQRVITEVLRRYPLWLMLRRANTSVSLGGVRLPAGAEVGFSPHALHHDPRYYDDPARFDPDRWLPARAAALPKGAYVPFAGGLHHCPGHAFAHIEIAIVAATLAARWRLVPVPGEPVRPKVIGLLYPNRLPMTAHRRSAP